MGWVRKGPEPKPPVHICKRPWARAHPLGSLWECDECGDQWEIYKRPGFEKRWMHKSTRADRMHGNPHPEYDTEAESEDSEPEPDYEPSYSDYGF
jgi:hypothetical protein